MAEVWRNGDSFHIWQTSIDGGRTWVTGVKRKEPDMSLGKIEGGVLEVLAQCNTTGDYRRIFRTLRDAGLLMDEKAEACVKACKAFAASNAEWFGPLESPHNSVVRAGRAYDEPGPWRVEHHKGDLWMVTFDRWYVIERSETNANGLRDTLNAAWKAKP